MHVKFRWGGQGYIQVSTRIDCVFLACFVLVQRRLVSQHITVKVKTLHGKRKMHQFTVSIFDTIETIRQMLCEADPDSVPDFSQPKFIYP